MGAMKDKAIEPRNMTSHELCDVVMRFCERVAPSTACSGRWVIADDAREVFNAAAELQLRHGGPLLSSFTHPEAKKAAEAAMNVASYSQASALLRAASTIDEQAKEITDLRLHDALRKLAIPTRDELLKERDTLLKERDRLRGEYEKQFERADNLKSLVRALRDVNADLDRQRCEQEKP